MAAGLGSKMGAFVRRRPLLVTAVVGMTAAGVYWKKRVKLTIPDGDIWLDMDLSRPLATSTTPLDVSGLLRRSREPLHVRDVVDAVEMATEDSRVVGLVGRFGYRSWNTLSLACTQEVRDAICKFREYSSDKVANANNKDVGDRRSRFTIATADTFGDGLPAVGEYYLASSFEKIFVQRTGFVGLTGIGVDRVFIKRFLDKYGIKPQIFAREEYKSYAQSLTDTKFTEANRDATFSLLQSMFDDVIDNIARSRGFKSKKELYGIVNDCPMAAGEALARNLIDGIMYPFDVDDMIKDLLKGARAENVDGTTLSPNADASGKSLPTRVPMSRYIQYMRARRAEKEQAQEVGHKKVAVIEITGGITREASAQYNGPATSSAHVCETLRKAKKDPTIGAVVLRVESPGGSVVASDSISAAVKSLRDAGKPVVCSMGNVAASGGYMIAAACTEIVALPTTVTGSIGVVGGKATFQRLLAKYGADVDSVWLGPNQSAFSLLSDFTPLQRKRINREIDEVYESFLSHVAQGRNLTVEQVRKVARGRAWTGRQAHEFGLVDYLGGLDSAVARSRVVADLPEDTMAVIYPSRKTFAQILWTEGSHFFGQEETQDEDDAKNPRQSLLVSLAEACLGLDTVATLSSAVTLMTSFYDVTAGKVPSGMRERTGAVEMRMDNDDIWG